MALTVVVSCSPPSPNAATPILQQTSLVPNQDISGQRNGGNPGEAAPQKIAEQNARVAAQMGVAGTILQQGTPIADVTALTVDSTPPPTVISVGAGDAPIGTVIPGVVGTPTPAQLLQQDPGPQPGTPVQPDGVIINTPQPVAAPVNAEGQTGDGAANTGGGGVGGAPPGVPSLLGAGPSTQAIDPNTGTWTNVTPSNANITDNLGCGNFGTTSGGVDPRRASDIYVAYDCQGIWKSTDYGSTWTGPINTGTNGPTAGNGAGGIAVADGGPGNPPIIYYMNIRGAGLGFWRSLDGGVSFTNYNVNAANGGRQDWYVPAVDPFDSQHIISAGHEFNQLVESFNGGQTWTNVPMDSGMNQGGGTAAIFFINRGTAGPTSDTFLYQAQGTGGGIGTWRTTNGGVSWTKVSNNEHPHGNSQIYQPDFGTSGIVFMAGIYAAGGWGVLRSTDYGATWTNVGIQGAESTVWGTPNKIYAHYSWACGGCNIDPGQEIAPAPGITGWVNVATPANMLMGAAKAIVTYNGEQYIFVTSNWMAGTWRYAEAVGVALTPTLTPTPGGPTNTPTPVPTVTPTPTQTRTPTPTATNIPSGTSVANLHVVGNRIVNGAGQQVKLAGVNKSGSEYMCKGTNLVWDGPSDTSSVNVLKSWAINIVRLPLNEQCWLGINNSPQQYSAAAYRQAIVDYTNLLTSQNVAVIMDLQWGAPNGTNADGLQPMPNADNSPAFWTSVATTFKDNGSVIFDLYNEPYPDNNGDSTAAWQCLRDGCTLTTNAGVPYQAAGMQSLVNAVRATGATNVIMSPGVQFTNGLSQWLTFKPTDSTGNLVAAWHSYADQICAPVSCWTSTVEPVLTQVPLITGEIGERDCQGIFVQPLMDWLDARGGNYVAWAWNTYDCQSFPSLISNFDGTPTGFGVAIRNHYLGLVGVPTPTSPPLTPFTTTYPFGIRVGSNTNYTATDGTVYYGDNVTRPGMIKDVQAFAPYTTTNTIAGTSDPTLYQGGRAGVYGNWTFSVPNGNYRVTFGVSPTTAWPITTGFNTGEYGMDQTIQGQRVAFCNFSYHTGPPDGCPGDHLYPAPVTDTANLVSYDVGVFNQALQMQVAASFGGGRTTMLNTIKVEQIGGVGTPTSTPTPVPTNTPTVTPTPQPVFTDGFETGALGNPPWNTIQQTGSGAFTRVTTSNNGTYAMQFSRTSNSSARSGVVASRIYTAAPTQYARACYAADSIPTSTVSRIAHILGLGDPSSNTQTLAYFSIHNTNQLEASFRRRDGTYFTSDVLTITSTAYRCYEISVNTGGASPVITFRSTTTGSAFTSTQTDTSTGSFTSPALLRIGLWSDQQDPPWAGAAQVRIDDVILSNSTLPTSVP